MRRTLPFALLALALLLPQGAAADTRIIVKREPGLDRTERRDVRRDAGVRFLERLPLVRTEVVTARDGAEALRELRRDDDVVYAEIDRPVHALDPLFDQQWGLENDGSWTIGGIDSIPDADMDVAAAWLMSTGEGRTVAVVDTGVDASHPDLDGHVAPGYDWVDEDGDASDEEGHGTHVAGTIAAARNDEGVAGVAPDARILPLRVLNAGGSGSVSDVIAAYHYAGERGIRVVNASLGGTGAVTAERAAIAAHDETLFVVAAGNGGEDGIGDDNDADADLAEYPCSYDLGNVLCVGASRNDDRPAGFSNFGATTVDLFAPGWGIWSTVPGGDYEVKSGTSMAAPHVAAAAALLFARNPMLSAAEVKAALLGSVDANPDLAGKSVTGGRANAEAALRGVDGDGDGVVDGIDTCPTVANADQTDTDGDGVGDACESAAADPDGDGVTGTADACPFEAADYAADGCPGAGDDSDGDGIADAYDACADEPGPGPAGCPPDADADGVPDSTDQCDSERGLPPTGCPAADPVPPPTDPGPAPPTDTAPPAETPPPVYVPPADRDGDGRADASDGCPSEAAWSNDGCPLPALKSLRAKRRRKTLTITLRADRAATFRVTVQRRKRGRWVRVTRKTVASESGRVKIKVRRARKGRYRAVVKLSSSAGSVKARRIRFRVR